ncbi:universal stress protein [Magnetospirillum aberrantis]|uniref:Universal stress protein n=1 Tax=Magnetospirillum aberrantis SpK TaxID=908842 RepID=A0A7C9UUG6_9PROT|nr:universal stress protein [Magnetospirillum aberrantis]NFV78950.1 universal stress protein [Magnetospirillum aberrantis SpK]
MTFKDILVHVDNTREARNRLRLAAGLARAHDGHLTALNVRGRPDLPPFIADQFGPEIQEVQGRSQDAAAREARVAFDAAVPTAGITTEWRDVDGTLAENLILHARYADLTVVGQPEPGADDPAPVAALALEVGRPLLVVPFAGTFDTVGRRVVVAWNASREATRAVHDALPLLKTAEQVRVIAINPGRGMAGHGDVPGADICLHLSRHGVRAVCEHVASDDLNAGAMLLSRVADEDADMLVMGAYGRSRLREMVLGGATRHILRHMTVPVLLSH